LPFGCHPNGGTQGPVPRNAPPPAPRSRTSPVPHRRLSRAGGHRVPGAEGQEPPVRAPGDGPGRSAGPHPLPAGGAPDPAAPRVPLRRYPRRTTHFPTSYPVEITVLWGGLNVRAHRPNPVVWTRGTQRCWACAFVLIFPSERLSKFRFEFILYVVRFELLVLKYKSCFDWDFPFWRRSAVFHDIIFCLDLHKTNEQLRLVRDSGFIHCVQPSSIRFRPSPLFSTNSANSTVCKFRSVPILLVSLPLLSCTHVGPPFPALQPVRPPPPRGPPLPPPGRLPLRRFPLLRLGRGPGASD